MSDTARKMSTPISHPSVPAIAVVGMFDGVHLGHQHLLKALKAAATSEHLRPLAITFTNHPLEVIVPEKAPKLLCSPDEKKLLLKLAGVDVAMLKFDIAMRNTSSADFLQMLRTQHNVKEMLLGFNNRFGHDAPRDFESYRRIAESQGVKITMADEYLNGKDAVSSSDIRKHLLEGNIEMATRLLGRPYSLTGTIGHGQQIGRTIGFPTANLNPTFSRQLIPATGVYAAMATLPDGEDSPAVVNIGNRPTVNDTNSIVSPLSIEAHLINFSGNLYGKSITLRFMRRLRSERRFPSLDALRKAIAADCNDAVRCLQLST